MVNKKIYFAPETELVVLKHAGIICGSPDLLGNRGEGYSEFVDD